MDIIIHNHYHTDPQVTKQLSLIIQKLDSIMASKEQFLTLLSEINASTDNIAQDLLNIKKQLEEAIAAGGLTKTDEEEILTGIQGAADKLKVTAESTPDGTPTPPVELK